VKPCSASERGSATVELVILAPVFGLLVSLVVVAGRIGTTRADVAGVAHSAAREITIARDPATAVERARAEASGSLDEGSPLCRTMVWQATVTPTEVTVTISCSVDLSGAALLPLPGSTMVQASSTEVIDHFRETTS
jgi:Flp pilus assembly protein TadG